MAEKKKYTHREESSIVAETPGAYALPPANTIAILRKGFAAEAFDRVQTRLGVTADKLADVVGIALRTLMRRKQEGRLQMHESERLLRVSRLFDKAVDVFEGEDAARVWFRTPQKALGGSTPLDFAETEIGAREVENLLGRIEHGVFA